MNLHPLALARIERGDGPVRVGLIGAGKFGSMFLSQVRRLAGIHVVGIADLDPQTARSNLAYVGWPDDRHAAGDLDTALRAGTTFVGDDAMALIRHLDTLDHPFTRIGVTGYPEGHPKIDDDLLIQALLDKQPYASSVTTQMCFDVEAIRSWIVRIRDLGIDLPVTIGIPGVTELTKLIGISARIGVGTSLRFLSKNRSLATKLLRPYAPDDLVGSLAELAEDPALGVNGLHIYTFNQVEATFEWYLETRASVSGGP